MVSSMDANFFPLGLKVCSPHLCNCFSFCAIFPHGQFLCSSCRRHLFHVRKVLFKLVYKFSLLICVICCMGANFLCCSNFFPLVHDICSTYSIFIFQIFFPFLSPYFLWSDISLILFHVSYYLQSDLIDTGRIDIGTAAAHFHVNQFWSERVTLLGKGL